MFPVKILFELKKLGYLDFEIKQLERKWFKTQIRPPLDTNELEDYIFSLKVSE
ncbi:MAG: hypothetical protein RXO36_05890 [Candidatus Nanopusillus acidilobi]